jgi:hypothetical protein
MSKAMSPAGFKTGVKSVSILQRSRSEIGAANRLSKKPAAELLYLRARLRRRRSRIATMIASKAKSSPGECEPAADNSANTLKDSAKLIKSPREHSLVS